MWQDHLEQSQPALEEALLKAFLWTHRELAALLDEALLQMCELYETMERAAVVPAISCEGDVTLIPKSLEATGVEDLRPITVVSIMLACGRRRG